MTETLLRELIGDVVEAEHEALRARLLGQIVKLGPSQANVVASFLALADAASAVIHQAEVMAMPVPRQYFSRRLDVSLRHQRRRWRQGLPGAYNQPHPP